MLSPEENGEEVAEEEKEEENYSESGMSDHDLQQRRNRREASRNVAPAAEHSDVVEEAVCVSPPPAAQCDGENQLPGEPADVPLKLHPECPRVAMGRSCCVDCAAVMASPHLLRTRPQIGCGGVPEGLIGNNTERICLAYINCVTDLLDQVRSRRRDRMWMVRRPDAVGAHRTREPGSKGRRGARVGD